MLAFETLKEQIFSITNEDSFNSVALELFELHKKENPIYRKFVLSLPESFHNATHYSKIPFLPISFFKSHKILLEKQETKTIFKSSATTGSIQSLHYVPDPDWYLENSLRIFKHFYGNINDYCILALLPSYLEREGSSLIYMAKELIAQSHHERSGFYLDDHALLKRQLEDLKKQEQKTILLGVSFALVEFSEKYSIDFPELIVMETGGMKGRRKEMIRDELHAILKAGFGVPSIHSEYGMTELFSQAYSKKDGLFSLPPWMKIMIRDANDPFALLKDEEAGGINIIDLANIYSCPFIATQDLGKHHADAFEILGRFDNSDIRGCNLLVV